MTPKQVTPEQEIIFKELRRHEKPIDNDFYASRAYKQSAETEAEGDSESETGAGFFNNLKNMWSKDTFLI